MPAPSAGIGLRRPTPEAHAPGLTEDIRSGYLPLTKAVLAKLHKTKDVNLEAELKALLAERV